MNAEVAALDVIALWWAENMVGNEISITGDFALPDLVAYRVVDIMVSHQLLGWPDRDSARAYLEELGHIESLCLCDTIEDGWRPCPQLLCERSDHNHA